MQPYLFPYLGYFQLLGAVDKFVIYDDINFIKQRWINRNNILIGSKASLFSVPLRDASSFRHINETEVHRGAYGRWLRKFLTTVDQNYRKAPFYEPVRRLLGSVFEGFEGSIAALALRSVRETAHYLDIRTTIVETSRVYGNDALRGQDRIIDICLKEGADHYLNAIGGKNLYAAQDFEARRITLHFITTWLTPYAQFGDHFVPSLSIVDVMMFNSPDRVRELLREFDIV